MKHSTFTLSLLGASLLLGCTTGKQEQPAEPADAPVAQSGRSKAGTPGSQRQENASFFSLMRSASTAAT